jgi:hypothetical protein
VSARAADPLRWRLLALFAALTALAARLVPVLRGGGLWGLGNYDDGVYYAAGTAVAHGLLPYRDFLLLHPPGIVVALAPFGLLARVSGDASGFAAARLAWIGLGAANTILVARILRPLGLLPAAGGALVYALAFPAIYMEYTTLLEAPAQTCVLVAILLVAPTGGHKLPAAAPAAAAGALLGASATFKIWGVVAVATVVVWLLLSRSSRTAVQVLAGAAAGVTLICLPFFVAAPGAMWRMVVLDQLGRGESSGSTATRLAGIVGLGLQRPVINTFTGLLVGALVLVAVLLAAAMTLPVVRLAVVLAVCLSALLLLSPSWFLHYPGLASGPLAVGVAAGGAVVLRRAFKVRRYLGVALTVLVVAALAGQAYPLTALGLGRPFPGRTLARGVASTPGCVTADDPAALVEMNVLSRNLDRGCPFVADLGGYSYELAHLRGQTTDRRSDGRWQQIYLDYLRTGTLTLSFRYAESGALASRTRAAVEQWSARSQVGPFVVRQVPSPG